MTRPTTARRTNRPLTLGVVMFTLFLGATAASALTSTGYVKAVTLTPGASPMGSAGTLRLDVSSEPGGAGDVVAIVDVCSTGASHPWGCDLTTDAYGPKYILTSAQLLTLYKSLVVAATKGLRVTVVQGGSRGSQFQGITILAAP